MFRIGRASRKEYILWLIGIVLMISFRGTLGNSIFSIIIQNIVVAVFLYVVARRFHDIGRSAIFVLLIFIPFFNFIVLLALAIIQSDPAGNRYGDPHV